MNMDVSKAIEPKSDQLNADDLITGMRIIKIRDVKFDPTAEAQKLWIYFDGDNNKPWKPCKTAARTLVAIWGADASKWVGLRCAIYCDDDVTWGGAKVGGIRVSRMEGLTSARTLMLTKTRGKKGATVIKPLDPEKSTKARATDQAPLAPDRETLRSQMADVANDADAKAKWWNGLNADERAVVKDLAATPSN